MRDGGGDDAAFDFASRLVPSVVVAMGGTELVSYLSDGPVHLDATVQSSFIDGLLAKQNLNLSPKASAELRRTAMRFASSSERDHISWNSMPIVRGSVSLSLWQSALELALTEGGRELCRMNTGNECMDKFSGFQERWGHYKSQLRAADADAVSWVGEIRAPAEERTKLRNRLLHGKPEPDDLTTLRANAPKDLVQPLVAFRDRIVIATLSTAFDDPAPQATVTRALFTTLGLPSALFEEAGV